MLENEIGIVKVKCIEPKCIHLKGQRLLKAITLERNLIRTLTCKCVYIYTVYIYNLYYIRCEHISCNVDGPRLLTENTQKIKEKSHQNVYFADIIVPGVFL